MDASSLIGARLLNSGLIAAWTLEAGGESHLYFFDIEGKNIGSIGTAHHDSNDSMTGEVVSVQNCLTGLALSYSRMDQTIKLWSWQDLGKQAGATVSETIFPATKDPNVYAEINAMIFLDDSRCCSSMWYPFDDGLQLAWTASPNFDDPAGVARIIEPEGNDLGTVEVAFLGNFEVSSLQVLWNGVQLNCYCNFNDGRDFREVYCRILEPPKSFSKRKAPLFEEDVCGIRLESDSKSVKLFDAQSFETWNEPGYPPPRAQWEAEKAYRLRGIDSDGFILLESFMGEGVKLNVFSGAKLLQTDEILRPRSGYHLLKRKSEDILDTLSDRERQVLKQRFRLSDGYSRTLEEVRKQFEVTRERIRQIEAKNPRKPRNSTGITQLEDFLDTNFLDLKPEDTLPPTEELDQTEFIQQKLDDDLESDPLEGFKLDT